MWLFPIPKGENAVEGEQVSRQRGDKLKCDDAAVGYSKESVPKVLQTMEGPLEQVCGVWRGLLLRGLGLQRKVS